LRPAREELNDLGAILDRSKGAGLRVHGPTATAACMCDQDIDPTPFLDDPHYQRLDRLVVPEIHLDPHCGAARSFDLCDARRSTVALIARIGRTSRCREARPARHRGTSSYRPRKRLKKSLGGGHRGSKLDDPVWGTSDRPTAG